jgi:hypothetical protein
MSTTLSYGRADSAVRTSAAVASGETTGTSRQTWAAAVWWSTAV